MANPIPSLVELRALPGEEQAVLMGLAGLGLPATNAHLALTLQRAGGFPQAPGWADNPRGIQEVLVRLRSRGFLEERRGYWQCAEGCLESAARLAFGQGALRRIFKAGLAPGGLGGTVPDGALRSRAELRLEFLEGRPEQWLPLRERFAAQFALATEQRDPLALVCAGPFEPAWFEALPPAAQAFGCHALLLDTTLHGRPIPGFQAWMDDHTRTPAPCAAALPFIQYLLLQGRLPQARAWMEAQPAKVREHFGWFQLEALAALARGDARAAAERYGASLAAQRKLTRKRNQPLGGLHDPLYILALLATREGPSLRLADERLLLLEREDGGPLRGVAEILGRLARALAGAPGEPRRLPRDLPPLGLVLAALASHLGGETLPPDLPDRAQRACADLGLGWFSGAMKELMARQRGAAPQPTPLLDLVPREAPWERTLDSLLRMGAPAPGAAKTARLAWFVKPHPWDPDTLEVQAREQKQDAKGVWTKGRPVSLAKLRENGRAYDYLTPQDQKAISAIKVDRRWGADFSFRVDGAEAVAALVGHPCVLWEGPQGFQPMDLVEGKPGLRVRRMGDQLELRLEPDPGPGRTLAQEEGPGRRRIFLFEESHRRLRDLLGERLVVPASAQERVLRSLAAVAPLVDIHSDVDLGEAASARAGLDPVEGGTGPTLVLLPQGEGLRIQVRVHPVPGGPALMPGQGGATLVVDQGPRRLLVRRDPEGELRAAMELVAALPALGETEGWDWSLADPEACMELLLQAEAARARYPVVWPGGEARKAPRPTGLETLRLKAKVGAGWLELEGELRVDGAKVLDLKQLLQRLEAGSGRFVPMEDGTFLALDRAFRRRLLDLNALGDLHGKVLRLHPAALAALGDLDQGLGDFQEDRAWKIQAARIRAALRVEAPLPPTLEADLRDYQEEGYRWMMRLAEAGMGACLADDMGLGKTLQALALLLARGGKGPALVVAPTSVCANWFQEAARFAPTLRLLDLATGDRPAALEAAGPLDVVVASYGLLHQEAEALARVAWSTVILDEAQAIKNALTRRSRAAMALQADFRLVLSGTPVENHLGELWNLMRFLNPGLLGTLDRFQTRFQIPIERQADPEALRRLKRAVGPFLLRRTKAQVLEELPPRTEITLEVEPSPEEAAFLEALRQSSLEDLEGGENQALQVLAAIMRLRRACCHPELVQPGIGLASSKAEAFLELLGPMRENRHRALVFSQFTDHLALIRRDLERLGVPYLYLDGSTPARARAAAVAAFQRGEGEVFLISLKAGGTGLNLTGADYVVHMDPWWNPAVEDQASDRAHRLGQTRPVTIYRLVLRGSIEQRIVELHGRKRQLADNLLEGSASPARLDAETLLGLLRGN